MNINTCDQIEKDKKYEQIELSSLVWIELYSNIYMCVCVCVCVNNLRKINRYVFGGARRVMAIVVGNGHGDTSSNPGRDWLHFT